VIGGEAPNEKKHAPRGGDESAAGGREINDV